ncbi:hypothetical protein [Paenibacillus sp. HB172176]|uniref:hypothetical protein n=1 Tax=Paenibacillus sp. HB172176 TaxID=2493690 RepID=UPI001438B677|nr:hypothetical protein [Paenibacillus sp. HB172176]
MKSYLKLVQMELHRFRWILLALMGLTAAVQIIAVIWKTKQGLAVQLDAMNRIKDTVNSSTKIDVDKLTFDWVIFSTPKPFILVILVSIAALSFYVFFIWYRDWLGRSTFIYRLLMLPAARMNLYWAKLTSLLLLVFSMLSFQLVLLPIEGWVFKLLVPSVQRADSHIVDVISRNQLLPMLFPRSFEQFIYFYGMGMTAVIAVFTAILLERSYRRIGILYGVTYLIVCLGLILFPVSLLETMFGTGYFFGTEIFMMELFMFLLVLGLSLWLGNRLLSKKVTV